MYTRRGSWRVDPFQRKRFQPLPPCYFCSEEQRVEIKMELRHIYKCRLAFTKCSACLWSLIWNVCMADRGAQLSSLTCVHFCFVGGRLCERDPEDSSGCRLSSHMSNVFLFLVGFFFFQIWPSKCERGLTRDTGTKKMQRKRKKEEERLCEWGEEIESSRVERWGRKAWMLQHHCHHKQCWPGKPLYGGNQL